MNYDEFNALPWVALAFEDEFLDTPDGAVGQAVYVVDEEGRAIGRLPAIGVSYEIDVRGPGKISVAVHARRASGRSNA